MYFQNFSRYCNRQMLICLMLGFSSGLPLFILYNLLTAWLKSEHVDLAHIGLFALVGFPYTWKFVWSPIMDRFFLLRFGRRRTWMLATQLVLALLIIVLGYCSPQQDLFWISAW